MGLNKERIAQDSYRRLSILINIFKLFIKKLKIIILITKFLLISVDMLKFFVTKRVIIFNL